MRPGQRGQALTELALLAPLFAGLLLLFAGLAHLGLTRLALIQLSRDAALMLARNGELWGQPEAAQAAALRKLAQRQRLLDPARLELSYESVAPLGLDRVEGLSGALQGPAGRALNAMAGLRRYRLRYSLGRQGLWRAWGAQGLRLEEAVVIHGDPWKLPASQLLERFIR